MLFTTGITPLMESWRLQVSLSFLAYHYLKENIPMRHGRTHLLLLQIKLETNPKAPKQLSFHKIRGNPCLLIHSGTCGKCTNGRQQYTELVFNFFFFNSGK